MKSTSDKGSPTNFQATHLVRGIVVEDAGKGRWRVLKLARAGDVWNRTQGHLVVSSRGILREIEEHSVRPRPKRRSAASDKAVYDAIMGPIKESEDKAALAESLVEGFNEQLLSSAMEAIETLSMLDTKPRLTSSITASRKVLTFDNGGYGGSTTQRTRVKVSGDALESLADSFDLPHEVLKMQESWTLNIPYLLIRADYVIDVLVPLVKQHIQSILTTED